MRRLLALVLLVMLAVAAGTVANYPGTVDVTWQGWEITTSVGVLVAAAAIVAAVLWLAFLLFGSLVRLPGRFRRNRRERRRRAGERALNRGMIALAAGDGVLALRHANRAQALIGATPMTLLLAAQAAQLEGDEAAAARSFTALLDAKEGAFLGLRGLVGQALKQGDGAAALRLAQRARDAQPKARWAFETVLALQTRAGLWEDARDTLTAAVRRDLLPTTRAEHHRGAVLYELSRQAEHGGESRRALALAATAHRLAPDLAALAAHHARLLIAAGRRRAARRAVEHAWRTAPQPELALIWGELGAEAPALKLVSWYERLAAENLASNESAIALAEAALAAQLWGQARRHLGQALAAQAEGPSRRLCLLMAKLEESEHPGTGAAREWFDRALVAPPDPTYVCARCGGESVEWAALCPHCHGFDTLAWRLPVRGAVVIAPAVADVAPLLAIPDGLATAGQWDR
jgi:HemY protein